MSLSPPCLRDVSTSTFLFKCYHPFSEDKTLLLPGSLAPDERDSSALFTSYLFPVKYASVLPDRVDDGDTLSSSLPP